ncbi:MAG: hypothetical protein RKO66_20410 [Candidatus Contendobacter sp.]|nr:hypothetical protein [Candidatus Contendobacter sp.]MDS4058178.1 hypothetical protein [Candidatus Contendobacter sp.]
MRLQREAVVEFPTAGVTGGLSQVKAKAYLTSHNDAKGCSYSNRLPEIKEILGHARDGEDLATIRTDVVIGFSDPDFEGCSYGLALALADKRARFGERGPFERIIATGVLSKQGIISRVDAFPKKLALVLETLGPNSLFLFPKENLDTEIDLLEKVAVSGGKMRAVSQFGELRDLWQEGLNRSEQYRFMTHSKGYFIKGLIFGFSAVSLITGVSIFLFRSLASQ